MTYLNEDYLKKQNILTIEEFQEIHKHMTLEIGSDEDAIELYNELVSKSIEYASIRARWTLMSPKEKMDADAGRTMTHDSLIVKFNQLSRFLRLQGKKASWRDELGYEEDDRINRKRIGDMGCYIAFIHAINAR